MRREVLFFGIAGQRGTGISSVEEELKPLLRNMIPEQTFAFLGSPFADNPLPFPLLWSEEERKRHPTTRLFGCWERLNQFCYDKLLPALQEKRVVFVEDFGLRALLHATAQSSCIDANQQALSLHSRLVTDRLVTQGISAPEYFIIGADVETVDIRICEKFPALSEISEKQRHTFIKYEENGIRTYFGGGVSHQLTPNLVDASLTIPQMAAKIAGIVEERLGSTHRAALTQDSRAAVHA